MKIAIASCGLGHVARGIETWAEDLARTLHEGGHSVLLCKGGGVAERPYELVLPCLQRHAEKTINLAKWTRRGLWRLNLSSVYQLEEVTFTWNLLKVLRSQQIDILHVQDPHVALWVQWANQIGWVRTRAIMGHGTEEPYEFLKKIRFLQHMSPFYLDRAKAQDCWRPTWTSIPNFVDTDIFHPGIDQNVRKDLNIPADALVILSVAAIKRHHKRVDYLIKEFENLRRVHPELPLWLVVAGGLEPETEEVMELGRSLLGDRVRFLVGLPRARMPELYRAADIFVLCSISEMMPIALLEATASGLPCIVNNHPSLEWMVGEGGETIEMASEGALANTLSHLVQDVPRHEVLGAASRQHCVQNFGRDRVVEQILEYYRFVLDDGRHPVPTRSSAIRPLDRESVNAKELNATNV